MVYNTAAIAAVQAINNKDTNEYNSDLDNIPTVENYHYYDFVIKKFFNFPVIQMATGKFPDIEIKTINSQTLWTSQHFIFSAEECKDNPRIYVEQNLERLSFLGVWKYKEKEALQKYLEGVQADYGIILDSSKLNYTTKLSWVVDRHSKDGRVEILSGSL